MIIYTAVEYAFVLHIIFKVQEMSCVKRTNYILLLIIVNIIPTILPTCFINNSVYLLYI